MTTGRINQVTPCSGPDPPILVDRAALFSIPAGAGRHGTNECPTGASELLTKRVHQWELFPPIAVLRNSLARFSMPPQQTAAVMPFSVVCEIHQVWTTVVSANGDFSPHTCRAELIQLPSFPLTPAPLAHCGAGRPTRRLCLARQRFLAGNDAVPNHAGQVQRQNVP